VTLKSQVANGLKWQAVSIIGSQLLSLVIFTTLARILDPSAFGMVALVGVYLGIVNLFVDQGIGMALIQRQELKPEHKDSAFWFNLGCAVVFCLGTLILAGPLSALFKEPRLVPLLRWSSLGLIIGASSEIHATLFTKAMDFRCPVIRTLIANATGGIVGIGMALSGFGVWSLVGQQLAKAMAGAIFLWRMSSYRPALRFSLTHLRDLFHVSLSIFASSILWFCSLRIDQMVIARFAGVPILGLYVIANKFPDLAKTIVNSPIAAVSMPALSQLQNYHEKMRLAIYHGMELTAIVAFALYVGLAAISRDLIPLLFGAKWMAATGVSSLLSIYALTLTLQVFIFPALLASGGVGKYVVLNIWQTVGVLVTCLVGIRFGVAYLVLGLIANSLIVNIPALLFLRQRIGLSPLKYCKPCLVPAFASIFMLAMIWVVVLVFPADMSPILRLICKACVGAIAYLAFTLIFARQILESIANMISHVFRGSSALSVAPAAEM
jgi:O-antigen/teichoic acid export membrane protein